MKQNKINSDNSKKTVQGYFPFTFTFTFTFYFEWNAMEWNRI